MDYLGCGMLHENKLFNLNIYIYISKSLNRASFFQSVSEQSLYCIIGPRTWSYNFYFWFSR